MRNIALLWICPKITHQAVMRQQLTFTISRDFSMAINIAASSFSAWYFLHQLFVSCPLTASAYDFEEESIFSNRAKPLLYLQYGKAQISIISVSQTKELITDTGIHDQVFLATPLPITCCVKTYETCEVELCLPMFSVGKT